MEQRNSGQKSAETEQGFPKQLIVLLIVIALGIVLLVVKSTGIF